MSPLYARVRPNAQKEKWDLTGAGSWGGCAWTEKVSDKTFCNSDNKDWSTQNAADPTRCGGLQGESVAAVCKSGRPDMQLDNYDSLGLGFFGRNFLFAAVKQVTECDTARTCEMNS